MPFGQIVLGPPGSGKTTYCNGMQQFLEASGRKVAVVNMDPANEQLPYVADVDISDLICLENVMEDLNLGPNGGLVYCMNFIAQNFDWLVERLEPLKDRYILFDFPGQVELYTHEESVHSLVHKLEKQLEFRLSVVHLVDAHHCTDSSKFISVVLLSLSSMVRMELPHINILSKMDLIQQYGNLAFNLEFYTDVLDLRYLLDRLEAQEYGDVDDNSASNDDNNDTIPAAIAARKNRVKERFRKMNEVLIEVIEDFSLVSFLPLQIEDVESLQRVVNAIDKSNGYVFNGKPTGSILSDNEYQSERIGDMEERYVR
ncbi:hypothetical protein LEN26_009667 [Aphanomyces euteiches]|nr:hypothetical protein LEN26_009667 [Aphanomyces euteiches]KAH9127759.1 hypothetical protein AeMF1_001977 [Aphanomyces euteiches]KAH9186587.1 hypothetical protein AeNC1_011435 [Aphanomyces euteiches]